MESFEHLFLGWQVVLSGWMIMKKIIILRLKWWLLDLLIIDFKSYYSTTKTQLPQTISTAPIIPACGTLFLSIILFVIYKMTVGTCEIEASHRTFALFLRHIYFIVCYFHTELIQDHILCHVIGKMCVGPRRKLLVSLNFDKRKNPWKLHFKYNLKGPQKKCARRLIRIYDDNNDWGKINTGCVVCFGLLGQCGAIDIIPFFSRIGNNSCLWVLPYLCVHVSTTLVCKYFVIWRIITLEVDANYLLAFEWDPALTLALALAMFSKRSMFCT